MHARLLDLRIGQRDVTGGDLRRLLRPEPRADLDYLGNLAVGRFRERLDFVGGDQPGDGDWGQRRCSASDGEHRHDFRGRRHCNHQFQQF
jgi:hypothetical protein